MKALLAGLFLLSSLSAWADGDYGPENRKWNGLSVFLGLARGLSYEVNVQTELDWSELEENDVVVILYPQRRLESNHLVAFIRNGGRVVLADDFGRADSVMERLSMIRTAHDASDNNAVYNDHFYAPRAFPVAHSHPFADGVEWLTCNHPSVLKEITGHEVVFATADADAIVVHGRLGYGEFVALSDPSIFINRMLQFPGNFQFARNLLDALKHGQDPVHLVIVHGHFTARGAPEAVFGAVEGGHGDGRGLSGVNRWLEGFNDYFLTEGSLRILAGVLALLVVLIAYRATPKARVSADDTHWFRPSLPDTRPSLSNILASVSQIRPSASYQTPAAFIRDQVVGILGEISGLTDPLAAEHRDRLETKLEACGGDRAVSSFHAFAAELSRIPPSSQSRLRPCFISRRRFRRLVANAKQFLQQLDSDGST